MDVAVGAQCQKDKKLVTYPSKLDSPTGLPSPPDRNEQRINRIHTSKLFHRNLLSRLPCALRSLAVPLQIRVKLIREKTFRKS